MLLSFTIVVSSSLKAPVTDFETAPIIIKNMAKNSTPATASASKEAKKNLKNCFMILKMHYGAKVTV